MRVALCVWSVRRGVGWQGGGGGVWGVVFLGLGEFCVREVSIAGRSTVERV